MSIVISKKIKGFSVAPKSAATEPTQPAPALIGTDIDRRIVLKFADGLAERSLRNPKRPNSHVTPDHDGKLSQGFPAWNSDFIRTPDGSKFALSISHQVNGRVHPFEVFVLGREAPSTSSEIAQMLSKVMAVADPEFLKFHLEALKDAVETPFEIVLPYSGQVQKVGSVAAAIAYIVEAHGKAIGWLTDERWNAERSPMLQAMSCIKEPKTEGQGGISFQEDVLNPYAGHSFPVFLKEAVLPSGQIVPFSLWFGGRKVPEESEGVCKLVSLALRHSDPVWTMHILNILREHRPHRNDDQGFRATVPGSAKTAAYLSTWAYVAEIVIARLKAVGRINERGEPVQQRSLFEVIEQAPPVTPLPRSGVRGSECPSCHEHAVIVSEGCKSCTSCSWSKCS